MRDVISTLHNIYTRRIDNDKLSQASLIAGFGSMYRDVMQRNFNIE
jgi:hypothetical protein